MDKILKRLQMFFLKSSFLFTCIMVAVCAFASYISGNFYITPYTIFVVLGFSLAFSLAFDLIFYALPAKMPRIVALIIHFIISEIIFYFLLYKKIVVDSNGSDSFIMCVLFAAIYIICYLINLLFKFIIKKLCKRVKIC